MNSSLFDDYCLMRDRGWLESSPSSGSFTVFNLTEYSNGHKEVTVTTLKDPDLCKRKKEVPMTDEQFNHLVDESNGQMMGLDDDLFENQKEIKQLSDLDREENKQRSLRRTRSTIRKKIIEGNLDHFLTLTYQENKQDVKECWKDWKKFIRQVQVKYPNLKYLVILERQKRGAVHFHAAVSGFIHANSVRAMWRSIVGGGNIDVKRKRHNQSLHGLAKYITKYLTKQYEELENFSNLYRCSRNIKLKQIKFYLPKEYAFSRDFEIQVAINIFLGEIKQNWEDSNGLYSCRWSSTLEP